MKQIPSQRYLQYAAACFLLATAFLLLYNYQQSYKVSNPHTLLPNNRLNDIDHPSTTRPLSDSRPAPSTNFLNLDAQSLPSGFYYPYSRPKHRVWQAGRKQARIHCKGPGGQLADDSSSSLLKAHAVSSSGELGAPNKPSTSLIKL